MASILEFLKKKPEPAQTPLPPDPLAAADFVPYYSHFNAHTLLTKNGELMQIVKIAGNLRGLDYESGEVALREIVRSAIAQHVKSDKLALWIHTIRGRTPLARGGAFKEPFAGEVHGEWERRNRWKYQFHNEIYITVLHEGQSPALFKRDALLRGVFPRRNRDYRNDYLESACEALENVVSGLTQAIGQRYQAVRLSLAMRDGVYYSEPMEFIGHLLTLRAEPFPLPEEDLSRALCTATHSFGFNALEAKTAGKKRFASVLTLKQYREILPETADRLLQAPIEFVVTQAFRFIPAARALKAYKEQNAFFEASEDEYCMRNSGVEDMLASDQGQPTDFGEHQTTIMILADDLRQLDSEIAKVQALFPELGLVTIREDLRLEECFWAQLPGNFEFIRRADPINTIRLAGFCRLNRFPSGQATGNRWGDALTALPTLTGAAYSFNFHQRECGHTVILDFDSFRDQAGTALLNFLLSESRRYNGSICLFDRHRSAQLLFSRLGGEYHQFAGAGPGGKQSPLRLNPFTLEDTPRNRSFLLAWCVTLLGDQTRFGDTERELLASAIDRIYAGPASERHLPGLIKTMAAMDGALAAAFSRWHGQGAFAGMVDGTEETIDMSRPLHAFDMDPVARRPECVVPVFAYLMHRVIASLNGQPAIIVVHEAWDMLENSFFAPRLESLMEMLTQSNAIFVFTTTQPLASVEKSSFATAMSGSATHIYIPDDIAQPYASYNLGLSDADAKLLLKMERAGGEFILRQNHETIALRTDFRECFKHSSTIHAVLLNDSKNLAAALAGFAQAQATP